MNRTSPVDQPEIQTAVAACLPWLRDAAEPAPDRALLACAVRLTARALAAAAPGGSVEVRIPPFVAVQCVSGPRHTRGTPRNVAEADPRTWLMLATGLLSFDEAVAADRMRLSGSRAAELRQRFPLLGVDRPENP